MTLQVVSPKVAVHKVTGRDDNGQETAEEHVFVRGDLLPNWVSPYQQFVLTQTGMARQVGDLPDPTLVAPENEPAPVVMPEHNPAMVVGNTGVTGPTVISRQVTGRDAASRAGHVADGELPDDTATKPVWEDVAVQRYGMTRNAAESMKKADLVDAVKKRHAAEQSADEARTAEKAKAEQERNAANVRAGDDKLPPKFGR